MNCSLVLNQIVKFNYYIIKKKRKENVKSNLRRMQKRNIDITLLNNVFQIFAFHCVTKNFHMNQKPIENRSVKSSVFSKHSN